MKGIFQSFLSSVGFTLIEVLLVIAVLGFLAGVVIVSINPSQIAEDSRLSTAIAQLDLLASALKVYVAEHNGAYPPDVNRGIPPGLEVYLKDENWPLPTWEGATYDWDNYVSDGVQTYQFSIRFCEFGNPSNCNFPKTTWAENFDYYSSVYLCLKGNCKAHPNKPMNHPGYCVNCEE